MPMMENRIVWIVCLIFIISFVALAESAFSGDDFSNDTDAFMTGGGEISTDEPYRGVGLTTYEQASEVAVEGGGIFTPIVDAFVVDFPGMPGILVFILTLINSIMIGVVAWIIITSILDGLPFTGG